MSRLFDIIQNTPFVVKGIDATWLLKQAVGTKNQDYIRAVLDLKNLEDTYLDDMDIQEMIWEVEERYEDDD